jgi:hypothetical protein
LKTSSLLIRVVCCVCSLTLVLSLTGCGTGIVKTGESFFESVTGASLYTAFGDSITADVPLTVRSWKAYPASLGPALKLATSDYAYSGDQACDIFPHQIRPNNIAYTTAARTLYSVMIGTNDMDAKDPVAYMPVYKTCLDAVVTWLGTTRSDKLLAGDDGVAVSGGCAAEPDPGHYGGMYCQPGVPGAVIVDQFFTLPNHPLYIWYSYNDNAAAGSAMTVTVDGTSYPPVLSRPPVRMLTQNGTSNSIGVLRLAVAPGLHHIAISTTTGDVAVLGLGSTRSHNAPLILLGDIPNQLASNPVASLATQQAYSATAFSAFANDYYDGLTIFFVFDRLTMLGAPSEMADQKHPNALGQQHLEAAYLAAAQSAVKFYDVTLPQ